MKTVSCLFSPASKIASLKAAAFAHTDTVVIDLEDAVHPKQKDSARALLSEFDYSLFEERSIRLGLRMNQIDQMEGIKDILFLHRLKERCMPFDFIIVPKVNNKEEMAVYRALFDQICAGLGIVALIETLDAVKNVDEIALTSCGLLLGQADLGAMLYAPNAAYLAHARAMICAAAARRNIMAMDGNSFEFEDMEQLERECVAARDEGFMGKAAIHPNQLAVINRVFSVSDSALDRYAALIDAHNGAAQGFSIKDGQVIAPPFVKKARRMLGFSNHVVNNQGA